ncbi:MAG TPA: hypothetical protein PK251_04660 [Candidatus Latescibacteria bacterium]|nr:hypothetical protein [Candidatus Latescibacterota bacterium]HOF61387.1 hypothetical protein [Candidatus Latescibacterota bacterium]HOS64030.1 hypothetical protein [Candidatus Latescibacterota bacterium]HPK74885.1 hypothetical protein [Candidatus Latescibacterota bacterium]
MFEALAAMSTGKVVVLGITTVLVVGILFVLVVATAALLGPGKQALRIAHKAVPNLSGEESPRRIPTSVKILGVGVMFLMVGLGVVIAAAVPSLTGWGMFGVILLAAGIGLLLFYLFVAKFEKMTPPPRSAEEAD